MRKYCAHRQRKPVRCGPGGLAADTFHPGFPRVATIHGRSHPGVPNLLQLTVLKHGMEGSTTLNPITIGRHGMAST